MRSLISTPRPLRAALPFLAGAALVLGACGSDDDTASDGGSVETVVDATDPDITVAPTDASAAGDPAGSAPATACGLLDLGTVDALLGTSGVTTSPDFSLGLADGCRWATAATDVPALVLAYGPTTPFDQARDLVCDGTTPEPTPAAGAEAVACFGAVIAPAGNGVVLTAIDDPLEQWDDAAELTLATSAAATAVGLSAA